MGEHPVIGLLLEGHGVADSRVIGIGEQRAEQVQSGIEHGEVGLIGAVELACSDGQ